MIMEKYLSLKEALESTKEGEVIGFESLYFMTFEDAYQHGYTLVRDEEKVKKLMVEVYKEVYKDIERSPAAGEFLDWLNFIIENLAFQLYQVSPPRDSMGKNIINKFNTAFPSLSKKQIAVLLVRIESQLTFTGKDVLDDAPWGLYRYRGFTKAIILFDIVLLIIVLSAAIMGFMKLYGIFQLYEEKENPFGDSAIEMSIPEDELDQTKDYQSRY